MKFISLLFLLYSGQIMSQNMLVPENPRTFKNHKFREGERIQFLFGSQEHRIKGRIAGIDEHALTIEGFPHKIPVDSISVIYTARKGFRFFGELLFYAGIGYLVVGSINLLINEDHSGLFEKPVLIGGGMALAGGVLLRFRNKPQMIDDRNWRLIVVFFSD